jgi:proteasome alpha subunit
LEEKYRDDLTLEESLLLAVECLSKAIDGPLDPSKMKMSVIPAETRKIKKLSDQEVTDYISRLET